MDTGTKPVFRIKWTDRNSICHTAVLQPLRLTLICFAMINICQIKKFYDQQFNASYGESPQLQTLLYWCLSLIMLNIKRLKLLYVYAYFIPFS